MDQARKRLAEGIAVASNVSANVASDGSCADEIKRLMEENDRLRTGLNEVRDFLNKPDWGTYYYMDAEVYTDKEAALFNISYALG